MLHASAIQLARMSNQILQDQKNVLLKMYDNYQSAWKHKLINEASL